MKKFILGFLMLASGNALAQGYCRTYPIGTVIDGVALNAAAASRTFTLGPAVGGDTLLQYKAMVLEVEYTFANAGSVSVQCKQGQTVATADKLMGVCVIQTDGSCLLSITGGGNAKTASLAASASWAFVIGTNGAKALSCTVAHSGAPGAGDLVTIKGHLIGSGC